MADVLVQRRAVSVRQPVIRTDAVLAFLSQVLLSLRLRRPTHHGVTRLPQHGLQTFPHDELVVDDQDSFDGHTGWSDLALRICNLTHIEIRIRAPRGKITLSLRSKIRTPSCATICSE